MTVNLEDVRCFLLDMDGTFFHGDCLTPGAADFLDTLNSRKIDYLFLTNNSSCGPDAYSKRFARAGLDVRESRIFTSGEATILHLHEFFPAPQKIFLAGTPSLEKQMSQAGILLDDQAPQAAVLGYDTTLTYDKMVRLCNFVRAGLPYIATHPDFNCPTENGYIPDIGAMIAFVKTSTGRSPDVIIGKPNRRLATAAASKTGIPLSQTAIVGDRLYTDIAMGLSAGCLSILMLSGEITEAEVEDSPYQPDLIIHNLGELAQTLKTSTVK